MKRFMRVAFFLAVISALLLPALPAGSAPGAGVTIFSGTNDVFATVDGTGPVGICFPGLHPEEAGVDDTCPAGVAAAEDHLFNTVSPGNFPGVGTRCLTISSHGGVTVVPDDTLANNCSQGTGGTITGSGRYTSPGDATAEGPNPLGPTCGASSGTSAGGAADSFSVDTNNDGVTDVTYTISFFWLSSAGGTLPVVGVIDLDAGAAVDNHNFVSLTQARALPRDDGKVQCLEVTGTRFQTVGVSAVSPAAL